MGERKLRENLKEKQICAKAKISGKSGNLGQKVLRYERPLRVEKDIPGITLGTYSYRSPFLSSSRNAPTLW